MADKQEERKPEEPKKDEPIFVAITAGIQGKGGVK